MDKYKMDKMNSASWAFTKYLVTKWLPSTSVFDHWGSKLVTKNTSFLPASFPWFIHFMLNQPYHIPKTNSAAGQTCKTITPSPKWFMRYKVRNTFLSMFLVPSEMSLIFLGPTPEKYGSLVVLWKLSYHGDVQSKALEFFKTAYRPSLPKQELLLFGSLLKALSPHMTNEERTPPILPVCAGV